MEEVRNWPPRVHQRPNSSQRYSQLDLEDLHDNQSAAGIALNMVDSKRYFEGRSGDASQAALPVGFFQQKTRARSI